MRDTAKKDPGFSQCDRFIRIRDVKELTGLSTSYIYALSSSGQFPKSIPLVPGGIARAWLLSEITGWQEKRIAERNNGGAK